MAWLRVLGTHDQRLLVYWRHGRCPARLDRGGRREALFSGGPLFASETHSWRASRRPPRRGLAQEGCVQVTVALASSLTIAPNSEENGVSHVIIGTDPMLATTRQ
jgi:hypothetical protein